MSFTESEVFEWRELLNFRRQLLKPFKKYGRLLCGSFFELPLYYVLTNLTDIDLMYYSTELWAIPEEKIEASEHSLEHSLVIHRGIHPGFVRLFHHSGDAYKPTEEWRKLNHGPANLLSFTAEGLKTIIIKHIPVLQPNLQDFFAITFDNVFAVFCPYWPQEASRWTTRQRKNGWPTTEVIDRVARDGCHLVSKAHHSNKHDKTEWRFSFSQAELVLIHSWNDTQKYIYHILRLIKSDVVKKCSRQDSITVLCSYYFKTLMFWACEEKSCEFWEDCHMETSIGELLHQMIQWLIDRSCPNYFMPENKMMDHLWDKNVDISKEIQLLLNVKLNEISQMSNFATKANATLKLTFTTSCDFMLALDRCLIGLSVFKPVSSDGHIKLNLADDYLLSFATNNLFKGMSIHLGLMSSGQFISGDEKEQAVLKAVDYFQKSRACYYDKNVGSHLEISLKENLHEAFWRCFPDGRVTKVDDTILCSLNHNEQLSNSKLEVVYKDPDDLKSIRKCCYRRVPSVCEELELRKLEFNETIRFFNLLLEETFSGLQNYKLNIMFLISAAYRANIFYTCQRNYEAALNVCCEVFSLLENNEDYSKQLPINRTIHKRCLPIIVSRKWLPLFDSHIQTVFGFISLYMWIDEAAQRSHTFIGEKREVLIRILPIEFLRYIEVQCRRKLKENELFSGRNFKRFFVFESHSCALLKASGRGIFLAAAAYIKENENNV